MKKKIVAKKPKIKVIKKIGRPISLPGVWGEMARVAGNAETLGQEIGRSVRQIRRIAHKESPLQGATRVAVRSVAERYGLLDQLEEWEGGAK